ELGRGLRQQRWKIIMIDGICCLWIINIPIFGGCEYLRDD
ncbi:22869_t:CDS:2, partial [Gigaspora rosea]